MHADKRTRSRTPGSKSGLGAGPRVVILDSGEAPQVEILSLPMSTTLGTSFSHCGQDWRVTAFRTGKRVLIAEPERH